MSTGLFVYRCCLLLLVFFGAAWEGKSLDSADGFFLFSVFSLGMFALIASAGASYGRSQP